MGLWMWTQKKVVATSKWNLFPFTVSIATQQIVTVSTSRRLKFFPGCKNFCLLKGVWYKLSTNLTNKMAYEVFWLVCGNWWGSFHLHDLLSCKRKNRSCNLFAGHAEARFGPTRIVIFTSLWILVYWNLFLASESKFKVLPKKTFSATRP